MMRWMFALLVVLAGCDSLKNVPCDQCSKYGAVCDPKTKMCVNGLVLDMSMSLGPDMTGGGTTADMTNVDLNPGPMCTPATVATACSDATKPICGGDGNCRACNSSSDDAVCNTRSAGATPRCQLSPTNMGQCVQCRDNSDCGGKTPICGSDGACRGCAAHSECPSLGMWTRTGTNTPIPGICVMDGTMKGACVTDVSQIYFVDNGAQSLMTCKTNHTMNDGSIAKPWCDVQDAITAGSRPYIVVAGRGTFSYGVSSMGGLDINVQRSVTLIGPGANALSDPSKTAQLSGSSQVGATKASVEVSGVVTGIIDGFEIGNSTKPIPGVQVDGASTAILRHNWIHSSGGGGVTAASGATLTLDGNDIVDNGSFGISLTTTTFTITNNVIGRNGGGANSVGVSFNMEAAGSGVFAFNTVANNTNTSMQAGGIVCSLGSVTIRDSIVNGNTVTAGLNPTQFSGCTLSNVVTGTDSATGATQLAPLLDTNFRLKITPTDTQNRACCIDKLAAPGTPNADHDVDFTARPKGTGATPYDIGASEAE